MLYYSAESVIAELKANGALECEGIDDVGCPSPAPSSFTHEKGNCPGNPAVCSDCTNRICNQRVTVRDCSDKKVLKLATLFFSFIFMTTPRGGRIPKDDSHLGLLIRRELINKDNLKIC
jgi:hypothetical protein